MLDDITQAVRVSELIQHTETDKRLEDGVLLYHGDVHSG